MSSEIGFVLFVAGVIVLGVIVPKWLQLRRAEIIRTYRWPRGPARAAGEASPRL